MEQIHSEPCIAIFYSLELLGSHWLKLLSSVKHFNSLDSEAHWSNLSVSELFYQTLPHSYDVTSSSGETDFISPPEEDGTTFKADVTATKEQQ